MVNQWAKGPLEDDFKVRSNFAISNLEAHEFCKRFTIYDEVDCLRI